MARTVSGTLSANGESSELVVNSNGSAEGVFFHIDGTWGSGTAVCQFKDNAGNWKTIAGESFTANVSKQIKVPNNFTLRISLSGATSPSLFYQISSMALM